MSNQREFEGRTLEEALEMASQQLGVPGSELHYDVLEQGRKGVLGLGSKNVRIRVKRSVDELTDDEILDGERPDDELPPPAETPAEVATDSPAEVAADSPAKEARDAGPKKAEKKGEKREGSGRGRGRSREGDERGERRPRRRRRGRRGGSGDRQRESRPSEPREPREPVEPSPETLEHQPKVEQTLQQMVDLMGLELQTSSTVEDGGLTFQLAGDDSNLLKQRNGELLGAYRTLLNRMARRTWPGVGRIHVTTDGESTGRDEKLVNLTRSVAEEVSKTGRTRKLRPMNAYERRLVHLTVRDFTGLTSSSDGSGAMKRVRISKVQNSLDV